MALHAFKTRNSGRHLADFATGASAQALIGDGLDEFAHSQPARIAGGATRRQDMVGAHCLIKIVTRADLLPHVSCYPSDGPPGRTQGEYRNAQRGVCRITRCRVSPQRLRLFQRCWRLAMYSRCAVLRPIERMAKTGLLAAMEILPVAAPERARSSQPCVQSPRWRWRRAPATRW